MKKVYSLLLIIGVIILVGCSVKENEKVNDILADQYTVTMYHPIELQEVTELEFQMSGKIEPVEKLKENTFFYIIEDGHGYLSEGEIKLDANGEFSRKVKIMNPTNSHGMLIIHIDTDNDGKFNLDYDNSIMDGHTFRFSPEIEVPLSNLVPNEIDN